MLNMTTEQEMRKKRQKERGVKVSFLNASINGRKSDLIERFQSRRRSPREAEQHRRADL